MRLTIDHIRRAPQFTNTMLQRELDLRGLCISVLDEHPFLQLQNDFDVINLCNNALTTLESFPVYLPPPQLTRSSSCSQDASRSQPLCRVSTLIVHCNKIQKVSVSTCVRALPFLKYFVAEKNNFSSVKGLLFLQYWKELEVISLLNNSVWTTNPEKYTIPEIRGLLCHMCPKLRLIDNERVTHLDKTVAAEKSAQFEELLCQYGVETNNRERKVRKRGRIATADNRSSYGNVQSTDSINSSTISFSSNERDADTEEGRKLKLARLEERINADDISPEEFDELEKEIMKLSQMV